MRDTRQISVRNHGYAIEVPDGCPICHHHSEFDIPLADVADTGVQVVYRCRYLGCRGFFIGYYGAVGQPALCGIKPLKPNLSNFPESVEKISPTFVGVFHEAEEATALGLSQIAGLATVRLSSS